MSGYGGHMAIPVTNLEMHQRFRGQKDLIAVTILRQPKLRLISSFSDGSGHVEGMGDEDRSKMAERWSTIAHEKYSNLSHHEVHKIKFIKKMVDYISHPNMIGCYTKMLNGYNCYSDSLTRHKPFNSTALDIALSRLRQFFFVGIFEEYEKSIQVFHYLANVSTKPHWVEYKKLRTTKVSKNIIKTVLGLPLLQQFKDPYDDVVYEEAQRLFNITKNIYFNSLKYDK